MKKAFTLVELAIVIVIIGLLVSGVLAGQELIKQAKIRSMMKNIDSYKAATYTFKSKYNGIPGDMNRHSVYFQTEGLAEGNSNGIIDQANEVFEFWRALSAAKLIKGTYSGPPTLTVNSFANDGNFGYAYRCQPYLAGTGTPWGKSGCWMGASNFAQAAFLSVYSAGWAVLSAADTQSVDVKFDDGNPSTGKILATRPTNGGICTNVEAYSNTTGTYDLSGGDKLGCVLLFEEYF
jgi:prepilin-type N-terminal cleavage/methylation domain-containing protein